MGVTVSLWRGVAVPHTKSQVRRVQEQVPAEPFDPYRTTRSWIFGKPSPLRSQGRVERRCRPVKINFFQCRLNHFTISRHCRLATHTVRGETSSAGIRCEVLAQRPPS